VTESGRRGFHPTETCSQSGITLGAPRMLKTTAA